MGNERLSEQCLSDARCHSLNRLLIDLLQLAIYPRELGLGSVRVMFKFLPNIEQGCEDKPTIIAQAFSEFEGGKVEVPCFRNIALSKRNKPLRGEPCHMLHRL